MDDVMEGRLAGLSLLVAQVMASLACNTDNHDAWIDWVEASCDRSGITRKSSDVDETRAVRAARDQVEDTLRLTRELAHSAALRSGR